MREVKVATGVVVRDGRLLLTQRGTRSDFALMWESPGGKVEPGETSAQAVVRELGEEIGWSGATPSPLCAERLVLDARRVVIIDFFVVAAGPGFVPRLSADANVIGCGWFTLDQARALPCLPGNVALYRRLDREVSSVLDDAIAGLR